MPSLRLSRCVEIGLELAGRAEVDTVGTLGLTGGGHEQQDMAPNGHHCCHRCTGHACSDADGLVRSFGPVELVFNGLQ